ncbi:unnamed protein product [Meloidogyne enterolobii]|uniref:Uncharacterized protein n=1 Tax=Meloidogyne enterolobii TaxID=390850 RepID=A0ACB0YUV8_MELEN
MGWMVAQSVVLSVWTLSVIENENNLINLVNDKAYAKRICDLLLFRAILEFLKSMIANENYRTFLNIKDEDENILLNLIENFQKNIEKPQIFFTSKLYHKNKEQTIKLIKEKISKFVEDYIEGNLQVVIRGVKANKNKDKEIYESIMNLGWNVKNSIENENKNFLEAVYEDGNFHLLFNLDETKNEGNGEYMEKFLNGFREIINGFREELIEGFKGKF